MLESINHVNYYKKQGEKPVELKKVLKEDVVPDLSLDANNDGVVDEKDTSIYASKFRRSALIRRKKK